MTDHWTQQVGPMPRLTRPEYLRARHHQAAGTVGELWSPDTRRRYEALGATHWRLTFAPAGTVLEPVVVEPDPAGRRTPAHCGVHPDVVTTPVGEVAGRCRDCDRERAAADHRAAVEAEADR